ncbi:MAG: cation:proton antiporter, partial [Dehalococcoidia bacterium]|nr:cation:proton antiporter [Dehalococcoidia bacterium]
LPILTRVLLDLDLLRTPLGGIISSAGAIIGLLTFVTFAVLVGVFAPSPTTDPARLLISVAIFLVASFGVGMVVGPRVAGYLNALPVGAINGGQAIGWLAAVVLAGAALAEFIGIEAFFGAFLLGVFLANTNESVIAPLSVTTRQVLAPVFFVNVGIGINFTQGFDPILIAYVFVIAVLGKMLGVGLGAKLGGFSTTEALAMGAGMSARGAVGVILAQSALSAKLIDQRAFIALTVVALFTALLAGPVMARIIGAGRSPSPVGTG